MVRIATCQDTNMTVVPTPEGPQCVDIQPVSQSAFARYKVGPLWDAAVALKTQADQVPTDECPSACKEMAAQHFQTVKTALLMQGLNPEDPAPQTYSDFYEARAYCRSRGGDLMTGDQWRHALFTSPPAVKVTIAAEWTLDEVRSNQGVVFQVLYGGWRLAGTDRWLLNDDEFKAVVGKTTPTLPTSRGVAIRCIAPAIMTDVLWE